MAPKHDREEALSLSRRHLLAVTGGSLALGIAGPLARLARADEPPRVTAQSTPDNPEAEAAPFVPEVLRTEAWARIEKLDDGVLAVLSTLESGNNKTVCNGGLVAGSSRVLAIDTYIGPEGAAWVSEEAMRLEGRRPTDVVVTHYHGDHAGGLAGFGASADGRGTLPTLWMTAKTRDLVRERNGRGGELDPGISAALERAKILDPEQPTELDLGGRTARILPFHGHTPSDVVVETEGRRPVLFWGDLLWNGYFPNYVDAIPSALSTTVAELAKYRDHQHVGGHGARSSIENVDLYAAMVEHVGEHARHHFEKGTPLDDAAAAYALPESVAGWTLFSDQYFARAIGAWYRELEG
jgi:glyoxylase-like metal-dependent hydrolase (beta-lactamase superfamily II)